jgi:hypothetical protein
MRRTQTAEKKQPQHCLRQRVQSRAKASFLFCCDCLGGGGVVVVVVVVVVDGGGGVAGGGGFFGVSLIRGDVHVCATTKFAHQEQS